METLNYNFEKYKNYDFKTNWRDKIIPHLNNEIIIKSIERGILGYIHNKTPFDDDELYEVTSFEDYFGDKRNKYVAEYSSYDSFVMHCDELEEQIIDEENLDIDGLFLYKYPQYIGKDDLDLELDDDYSELFYEFRCEILQPYLDDKLKYDYKTYCLYGACYWYNLTFGYNLAKLVYPEYRWEIASSSKHLTVVCHEHQIIFDILHYDEYTPDFGALQALDDAFLDDEICYKCITCQYIL
jgi:hypothetical protein